MNPRAASGVPGVGEISWGSHFCHFYDTPCDLADTLVPYFKAGLDANEACLWVTAEPFTAVDARTALGAVVPDLSERERRGQIEIIDHEEWYLKTGKPDARSTMDGWIARERSALENGYMGLRLTGNTYWLERKDWASFVQYEELVNHTFRSQRIIGLCSYCFERCAARDVIDVVHNHQFAVVRRNGAWEVVESAALTMAREDLLAVQRTAEALRAADRRKDEFIAMLGHELRNPLAPIATAVQLMRMRGAEAQYGKELGVLQRQSEHMSRLVDDLLDVSRLLQGKIEIRRSRVELGEVVARAVETSSSLVRERGHALTIDVPEEGLSVSGDLPRLVQVVGNLLSNAAKYTHPGGRIEIRGERAEDEVRLSITDDGPGITPELLARVFEPFVQSAQTLERAAGGLGLGLPIVRNLVELHGGSVEIHSEVGNGTTVTIELPVRDPTSEQSSSGGPDPASDPAVLATRPRVLIVDDNMDAAVLLTMMLQFLGCEVEMAHDGASALAVAPSFRPRLALVDIGLPKLDGYEVVRRMRSIPALAETTFVAVTGYGSPEDRGRSRAAGFDQHLVKPVNLPSLTSLIDALGAHGS